MKLTELEPVFVGDLLQPTISPSQTFRELESVEGAQGIMFVCPKCRNHSILCWFKNPRNAPEVPADTLPGPGRWTFTGDTFDILSLSPSVDLSVGKSGCDWHGWVTNGEAK